MVAISNKKFCKIIRRDHLGSVGDANSQDTADEIAPQILSRTEGEGTKVVGSHKEVGTRITGTRMVAGRATKGNHKAL